MHIDIIHNRTHFQVRESHSSLVTNSFILSFTLCWTPWTHQSLNSLAFQHPFLLANITATSTLSLSFPFSPKWNQGHQFYSVSLLALKLLFVLQIFFPLSKGMAASERTKFTVVPVAVTTIKFPWDYITNIKDLSPSKRMVLAVHTARYLVANWVEAVRKGHCPLTSWMLMKAIMV